MKFASNTYIAIAVDRQCLDIVIYTRPLLANLVNLCFMFVQINHTCHDLLYKKCVYVLLLQLQLKFLEMLV